MDILFCRIEVTRSMPIPVSTCLAGRLFRLPSASLLNCSHTDSLARQAVRLAGKAIRLAARAVRLAAKGIRLAGRAVRLAAKGIRLAVKGSQADVKAARLTGKAVRLFRKAGKRLVCCRALKTNGRGRKRKGTI